MVNIILAGVATLTALPLISQLKATDGDIYCRRVDGKPAQELDVIPPLMNRSIKGGMFVPMRHCFCSKALNEIACGVTVKAIGGPDAIWGTSDTFRV